MFKNLKFGFKINFLPGLSALGFVVIMVVSLILGKRSSEQLTLIETGYSSSLELTRDYETLLTTVRRNLQEAVNARSMSALVAADTASEALSARLSQGRNNIILAGDVEQLIGEFQSYYAVARATSERMIDGEAGDTITAALQDMSDRYDMMLARLDSYTMRDRSEMADAFATARSSQRITTGFIVAVTVLALLLGATLSFFIIRDLDASVKEVASGFARISNGDFTTKVNVKSRDEIGDLARQMNDMVDTLRQLIGKVLKASASVKTAADELLAAAGQMAKDAEEQSSSSDETSSAMVEIAAQIDHVAQSAHELASNVDETATSIQQMEATSDRVATNAEDLLTSVEDTAATIEEMTTTIQALAEKVQVVDEVSRQAARLADEGGTALAKVIAGIGESGKDIGKILGIIEEIADQTNLLALNAAIEAARAGDVGRGFAVVAEEVRRLAERSVDSTREIGRVVESVQHDTAQAVELTNTTLSQIVEAITQSSSLVGEAHASTQEHSRGAQQILSTTTNMRSVTRELALAAKEQAAGAAGVMRAVEVMNQMTQQVADATGEQKRGGDMVVKAIEQIAAVAQQNLTATEQFSETTGGLAKEADELRHMTEAFTV